jgi:Arc/MetJ-type ribon-helix-helix transcriptional regulator
MVKDGAYSSISEIVEEHIRDLMLAKHDLKPLTQEQFDSVTAMKDEIRRRMESPDDQWLSEEEFDKEYEKLLAYADQQIKAGR